MVFERSIVLTSFKLYIYTHTLIIIYVLFWSVYPIVPDLLDTLDAFLCWGICNLLNVLAIVRFCLFFLTFCLCSLLLIITKGTRNDLYRALASIEDFFQSILLFNLLNISFHQWGKSSSERLSTLLKSVCPVSVRARNPCQGPQRPPVLLSFWMPTPEELVIQSVAHWCVIIDMRVLQKGTIRIYKAFYFLKGEVNIHHAFREPTRW